MGTLSNPLLGKYLSGMAAPDLAESTQPMMSAAPVNPHAAMTAPIGPPAQPKMAAPSALDKPEQEMEARREKIDWQRSHPWGTAPTYDASGQMTDPGNHPGKMGKFLHGLSMAGNIAGDIIAPRQMMLIPGTQLNREFEENNLNQGIQDIESERSKQGLEGAQAEEAEARSKAIPEDQEAKQQAEQDKVAAAYRKLGIDAQGNPIPREQLSPEEQSRLDQTQTLENLNAARAELARAQAAGVPENIKLAQERLKQAQSEAAERLGIAERGLSLREGQASGDIPTTQMRNMGEMAGTILPQMEGVIGEVKQLGQSVGPAIGRWNQLMVNKGGSDFPEFAGLDTDLDLLASAIVRTHFGARGGQQYREELRKQFGEAQSPEDLINRIQHAEGWIKGYAAAGKVHPASNPNAGPESDKPLGETSKPDGPYEMNGKHYIVRGGKVYAQ